MTELARLDAACAYLADAYVADALTVLELELTTEAVARSPVACELVVARLMLPVPIYAVTGEAVFVYWNATTYPCDSCGERRTISRVHVCNRWEPQITNGREQAGRPPLLCRPCIDDLATAGLVWR
jgi:predicted RNA-binding Zn-ribbon protein involved in translation (DUF1610 family)